MAQQPLVGQGLFIIDASRSHSDTHTHTHSVGLLWTSDQPDAETFIPDNTQDTDIHVPDRSRTRNRSKLAAADSSLRPRGQWGGYKS